jgi:hypothetical protein
MSDIDLDIIDFPNCCGAMTISGFDYNEDFDEDSLASEIGRVRRTALAVSRNLLIAILCEEDQSSTIEALQKDHGWKRLNKKWEVVNPNSDNHLVIMAFNVAEKKS